MPAPPRRGGPAGAKTADTRHDPQRGPRRASPPKHQGRRRGRTGRRGPKEARPPPAAPRDRYASGGGGRGAGRKGRICIRARSLPPRRAHSPIMAAAGEREGRHARARTHTHTRAGHTRRSSAPLQPSAARVCEPAGGGLRMRLGSGERGRVAFWVT